MSDDLNFMSDEPDDDDEDRHIAMAVSRRCINSIEMDLQERLYFDRLAALGDVDEVPFSDTDDDEEQQRARAHLTLVQRLTTPAVEKWSRQIEIARSLGPSGNEQMYLAACEREGVLPYPMEIDQ